MLSPEFIEEMKQKLLERQAQIEEDLKNIKPHVELGEGEHDTDAEAQEVEDDEVSQDVIATLKADLLKIEKSLAKIDDGSYGTDDDGREISEARLRALPWADKAI